jgi:predicted flap endonuclease-1-like 5' DNA nuclease
MSDESNLALGQAVDTAVGRLTVFNDGLPNTCSGCGRLQERFWLAANRDASRAGGGLCPECAGLVADDEPDPETAAETLGDPAVDGTVLSTNVHLTPGYAAQLLGIIPDEDLLVSGAASADEPVDTNPVPAPETAVEPVAEPAEADDLTRIRGIGPKMAPRLEEMGITTFRALAAAGLDELDAAVPANRAQIADWITQASLLAE